MKIPTSPLDRDLIRPASDWTGARGALPNYGTEDDDGVAEDLLLGIQDQAESFGTMQRMPNYLAAPYGQRTYASDVDPHVTMAASSRQGFRGERPVFRDEEAYGKVSVGPGGASVESDGDGDVASIFFSLLMLGSLFFR